MHTKLGKCLAFTVQRKTAPAVNSGIELEEGFPPDSFDAGLFNAWP